MHALSNSLNEMNLTSIFVFALLIFILFSLQ